MGRPLNILQVEDSPSDAALVVRLLEASEYQVHAERVETETQMRAALARQPWDAVIADYQLPQFDGPSALKVLRDTGLDIPFIVVSGAVGEDRAVAMMKMGAHDYVMKSGLARLAPALEREMEEARVRREQRAAAAALRVAHQQTERSQRLLDAVLTALLDAVVVYDPDGVVIHSNAAAPSVYGFDPSGMELAAILEKLQIPAGPGRGATHRALAGESVVALEMPAAERTLEISSLPIRDRAGTITGAVTVVRDISQRKRDELRLQQAHKLESLALLAGGIAHDFNNILTVVSGNISLALEDACPDCHAKAVLPAALECLQRAASLTRQLLAYAGKGAFVRTPVSVSGVGERTVALLQPSTPKRIRLRTGFAPGLPPLWMDPGQMEQIFSNLILNAIEAIPDGQPGMVSVDARAQGGTIEIEVSDNGCGIEAETRKRIFEPFFSTRFPGRGLGLAAVEGIVRTLNGRIEVESAVGRGTRMRVILPVPHAVQPPATPAVPKPASPTGFGTLLIVDDEPMVRRLAAALLAKRGIPVLEAATGKEAIERLMVDRGAVRAILLDIAMPEMRGDSALPIIRKLRPDVRVIVSSGFQDRDVQQHFSHMEECRFLPKPYTREQLLAVVIPAVSEEAI